MQENTHIEVWNDDGEDDNDFTEIGNGTQTAIGIFKVYLAFLFLWQNMFSISNAAIEVFLQFMTIFLSVLSRILKFDQLTTLLNKFPKTYLQARQVIQTTEETFKQFCVCSKCHTLYEKSDCIIIVNGKKESAKCFSQRFPNHPLAHMRRSCDTKLMKTIRTCR